MGYTKLFSTLITSTIWSEDDRTRLVWVTMLALADKYGEVHATIPGLARMACVDISAVEIALNKFLSPDLYSRSKESDGRRIEEIDGGWALLNHRKYRDMLSADEAKAANAERQARWRERQKKNNGESNESNENITEGAVTDVTKSNKLPNITYTDTDADADAVCTHTPPGAAGASVRRGSLEELEAYAVELGMPASDGTACHRKWKGNGWTNNGEPIEDWKATMQSWQADGWLASQKAARKRAPLPTTQPGRAGTRPESTRSI